MLLVPSPPPIPDGPVTRRRVLFGAAALALLGAGATACSTPPPPSEISALRAQLERARADSRLANDAAAAHPAAARALTAVAGERAAHAQALSDEVTRVAGSSATSTENTGPSRPPGSTTAPAQPATPQEVIAALRQSADEAAHLAATLSSYQAGLLGSVAAACTTAYTVVLTGPGVTS